MNFILLKSNSFYWKMKFILLKMKFILLKMKFILLKSNSFYWNQIHFTEKSNSFYWKMKFILLKSEIHFTEWKMKFILLNNEIHFTEIKFILLKSNSFYWNQIHFTEIKSILLKSNSFYWNEIHFTEMKFISLKSNPFYRKWNSFYWNQISVKVWVIPILCKTNTFKPIARKMWWTKILWRRINYGVMKKDKKTWWCNKIYSDVYRLCIMHAHTVICIHSSMKCIMM